MVTILKHVFINIDRCVDLPGSASFGATVRSRALVLWAVGAFPTVLSFAVFRLSNTEWLAASMLLLSALGVMISIADLLMAKRVYRATAVFCSSIVFGLIGDVLFAPSHAINALLFLSVTPVMFGFLAQAKVSAALVSASLLFHMFLFLNGVADTSLTQVNIVASAVACAGAAIAMAAYAQQASRARARLSQQRDMFSEWSLTDHLTGAKNRRAFDRDIAEIDINSDVISAATIIFIDLDRFKDVNDVYGHDAGDQVLAKVAERLTNCLLEDMTLYRIGGDEFAILARGDMNRKTLEKGLNCILETSHNPIKTLVNSIEVSYSLGVAIWDAQSNERIGEACRRADAAVFHAKRSTASSYLIYSSAQGRSIERRNKMATKLRDAISDGKIRVLFQPQHVSDMPQPIGFEALARWSDSELGHVGPDVFVKLAEDFGIIRELDHYIISESLMMKKRYIPRGTTVSINVSARTLQRPDFYEFLLSEIKRSGVAPSDVEIEITETKLVENWDQVSKLFAKTRKLGVRLAIDDFGVGYSSLSYLLDSKFNKLKIDRRFIDFASREEDTRLLLAIIHIAKSMNLECVAEGVETYEQLEMLRNLGCEIFQGYLFSPGIKPQEIPSYISDVVVVKQSA